MHPQEVASVKVRIPSARYIVFSLLNTSKFLLRNLSMNWWVIGMYSFSPDEEPDTLFESTLLQVDTLQNVDPVYKWPPELKHQTAQQMYAKGKQSNMCVYN